MKCLGLERATTTVPLASRFIVPQFLSMILGYSYLRVDGYQASCCLRAIFGYGLVGDQDSRPGGSEILRPQDSGAASWKVSIYLTAVVVPRV